MSSAIRNSWIQLRMDDPSVSGVTVHPEDGDLFSLSKEMIVRSGRIVGQMEILDEQLAALRLELEAWASKRSDVVANAYLILKGDHFLFLVVLKGTACDENLEDDLTDLDLNVARNPEYDLIKLSVLALPAFGKDVIRSFLPQYMISEDADSDAERAEPPVAS